MNDFQMPSYQDIEIIERRAHQMRAEMVAESAASLRQRIANFGIRLRKTAHI